MFTTYDYQSWDEKESTNNDEWYFYNKYKDDVVNGIVTEIKLSNMNDLILSFDNGVKIEVFIWNGYKFYEEELEQWRLIINYGKDDSKHIVIYNKHIE